MRFSPVVRLTLLGVLVLLAGARAVEAQQAVILVRHAEKLDDSRDPVLSPEGEARARRLADLLKDVNVAALYATEFQRTVLTLEPLAKAKGLAVQVVDSNDSAGQVERLRREHGSQIVALAGHSGSVPRLLKLLGHREEITIDEKEYTNLFIVIPATGGGEPVVLRLRY